MGEVVLALTGDTKNGGREKCITHYRSSHKILLVGEGDFSFSACLARAFGSAKNMVATSLDSEDELLTKYESVAAHLDHLKALGCTVLHGIDAYDMNEHNILKTMKFDRIVFNFPHAGHDPMYYEHDKELIERHKELLMAFFRSARKMLCEDGEIQVSHRNDYPFDQWKVKKLAKRVGLVLVEMVDFLRTKYPGYHNKRGGDIRSNETFPLGECYTFKFMQRKRSQTNADDLARVLSSLHV